MHTDKIKIQGVEFYYHIMMGLLGFLTTDAISKIDDSIEHIYTSIYSCFFVRKNFTDNYCRTF